MFGFYKRAQAETNVQLQLEQITQELQERFGPLSRLLWQDPYLLGYAHIVIGALLKDQNPGNVSQELVGMQLNRRLAAFTGLEPQYFVHGIDALIRENNASFTKGSDDGALWFLLVTGRGRPSDSRVAEAMALSKDSARLYELAKDEHMPPMASAAAHVYERDLISRVQSILKEAA